MRGMRSGAAVLAAAVVALAPAGAQQPPPARPGATRPASPAAGKPSTAPAAVAANPYAQRFAALCASCHGANGRSEMAGTPSLAGQHSFFVVTQLYLFREGRRANEAMSAVAKGMKDDDMRGFADYIATLPVVPGPSAPPGDTPDAARMKAGQALATEHRCVICHGADLSGGQQVPRLAHQREDYLRMTLQEFRAGKRVGYTPAMTEAVGRIPPADLDTLAYYIARLPAGAK